MIAEELAQSQIIVVTPSPFGGRGGVVNYNPLGFRLPDMQAPNCQSRTAITGVVYMGTDSLVVTLWVATLPNLITLIFSCEIERLRATIDRQG